MEVYMAQIELNDVTFYYEDYFHPVFEHLNLNLDTDWKMALIGRNGRGKTTLLHLIEGSLETSSGTIKRTGSISFFPYSYDKTYSKTSDVIKECIGGLHTMELEMERYLASQDESYYDVMERYVALDGFEMESKIKKELSEMKLGEELLEREFHTLSGGEQTCMLIIALFLRKDPFVLLDEPTNHLDLRKKEVLQAYLQKKRGYIIVSHDTDFLDHVTDHILSINKTTIVLEQGTYSTWLRNVKQKEQYELRTRENLIKEIKQDEKRSVEKREWSNVANTQKYHFVSHARTNGTRAYMRQAKAAEQRIIDHMEAKKKLLRDLEEEKDLYIRQGSLDEDCLVDVDSLKFGYEDCEKAIIVDLSLRVNRGDKIWIKGKNGAGKSTLLKIISGMFSCEGVTYADELKIAYATQEPRWKKGMIQDFLRNEYEDQMEYEEVYGKFLEYCGLFDLPEDFINRPLETLSSGELKKVDIARVLSMKEQLLLLDEPLNFMDVNFKAQLEKTLKESDLSILFVEHNEEFGYQVANRILQL